MHFGMKDFLFLPISPKATNSPRKSIRIQQWFVGLAWEKTIKYKRGRIVERQAEFSRYQSLLREFLCDEFPHLLSDEVVEELLSLAWTKDQEDRLDALLCALIGWWHLRFGGKKSEILGDDISGHILLPAER